MTKGRTLSRAAARAFYDSFGAKQDKQGFYEDAALARLIEDGDFGNARSVFEFGCGTGKFASRLLEHHLRADATYRGADLSSTMVRLAHERLSRFGSRASVEQTDGSEPWRGVALPVDRIVTTYVLDLLSDAEIDAFLARSSDALTPEGRLCIASLTFGRTLVSRVVMSSWRALFRLSPRVVGGCRPIRVAERLSPAEWNIAHASVVVSFGIASEVVVAIRRQTQPQTT